MRNVKSTYFINDIFTFINDNRKFKIVLYNKNMQKILGLTILDFRRISGKYIIGDPNKEGKEYNYKGELLFEGEYLNGKRNGKGKEVDGHKVYYEGEYLNGKRHGKGKEIDYFYPLTLKENIYMEKKMEWLKNMDFLIKLVLKENI